MDTPTAANADQVAYWNGRAGEKWAAFQARIDTVFEPVTRALLNLAAPREGESVLDVGCGCGATVLALAPRVGAAGRVVGVDVSEPMLALAGQRVAEDGHDNASLLLADAARHPFPPGSFDLLFSRFGVMFFDDPNAAFGHLRPAMAAGGRVAFACWQPMAANPWFSVPFEAVRQVIAPPPAGDPLAPGPFAFADPDRVRGILVGAGFSAVGLQPLRVSLPLAAPGDAASAVTFVSQIGPASRLLADGTPADMPAALAAIRAALAPFDGADGTVLDGAVWLVTARA